MPSITSTDCNEKTVIIFDDEEDILSICSYILTELGWTVYTFTNCNDILNKLAGIRPADGGIVATQTLKKSPEFRLVPVIYFSANADIASLAQRAGADAYLAKPFDLGELTATIELAQSLVTRKASV
jgi:CheY-like chemotaxis protein